MGGGNQYPGLPVPNPTTSYWQLPPHRLANHRTTPDLPTSTLFDYVIIGSGITGAATAYKLLDRNASLRILMLEARTAASGASGRNGGHCRAGYWLKFKEFYEAYGEDEAFKLDRLEEQNIEEIAQFVRENRVECDFQNVRTSDCFFTRKAWREMLQMAKLKNEVWCRRPFEGGLIVRTLRQGKEAQEYLGMPDVVGSATYQAHTQNPYLLVCSMLELALKKGLNLQTNTPAIEVLPAKGESGDSEWMVKTVRGTVQAKQVVFATNAYTNALHRGLASTRFLTPGRSQVTALRPEGDILGIPALRGSAGIENKGSGDYFLCRAPGLKGEGDVVYGGGRSVSPTREAGIMDDSTVNPKIAEYLHEAPRDVFGEKAWGNCTEVVRDWTGITCYTPDSLPMVGEVPGEKGLWMSVGMNGHGMAWAFRCAGALVEMMMNNVVPVWFPKTMRLARAWEQSVTRIPSAISSAPQSACAK